MTLLSRRDVLYGLGGGLAGTLCTPLPWTLLEDAAIWTQHRRGLPIPGDGARADRPAACTLCPAGCALRVRTVAGRPVFTLGEPEHPLGGGVCALGLTLHHLAHHPSRLDAPARAGGDGRLVRIARGAAVAAIAAALQQAGRSGRTVLVLDQRPGRAVSRAYRELLACVPGGLYVTPPEEGATLAALGTQPPGIPLGIDLERTRTLLSFGAPLLAGWGRPARMRAAREHLRVVQLDAWRSPSAALADEWLAVRPGSEGPAALALAHVLVSESLGVAPSDEARRLLARFDPVRVAPRVGVDASRLVALARSIASHGPSVAVGGGDPGGGPLPVDDERAIALLDVVLGSVGRPGGIVGRRPVPEGACDRLAPASRLSDAPDGAAGLLLIDAADSGRALPWGALERKLAPGAVVVSLSPFVSGLARRADILVPAPAPLEDYQEVLPTPDASVASYALSAPLLAPRPGATEPVELLREVARAAGLAVPASAGLEERLKRRAAAIQASGRGRLFVRTRGGFRETSPGDAPVWPALVEGGCWLDDATPEPFAPTVPMPSQGGVDQWLRPVGREPGLPLVVFAARGTAGSHPVSPILTKLYQETGLRPSVSSVAINPQTARDLRLVEGGRVRLESDAGTTEAAVRWDASLPEGRVAVAAGPDAAALGLPARPGASGALAVSVVAADLTWRGTRVAIREA